MRIYPIDNTIDNQTFSVVLDGKTFRLYFRYNYRDAHWYFSAKDSNGDWLVQGRRVVGQAALIPEMRLDTAPEGVIFSYDASKLGRAPTKSELGQLGGVQIAYLTAAELA